MAKYASKKIYKIRKMLTFLFMPFFGHCDHTVACHFLHLWTSMSQVSSCLYKNVVNETKPSQRKNCLVPVDMKNTIGSLGKKCKLIIKIILFVVNNNS